MKELDLVKELRCGPLVPLGKRRTIARPFVIEENSSFCALSGHVQDAEEYTIDVRYHGSAFLTVPEAHSPDARDAMQRSLVRSTVRAFFGPLWAELAEIEFTLHGAALDYETRNDVFNRLQGIREATGYTL